MPELARPPAAGFERPAFSVVQVAIACMGHVECPSCAVQLVGHDRAREHWAAGHFDRRPLDTSNLPPARRILGRGAGPTA